MMFGQAPQRAVTPEFSMTEAMTMLDEYKGGHQKYPIAHGVVDAFVDKYQQKGAVKYSSRHFSDEFTQKTLDSFGIDDIKDSLQVQKRVFSTLLNEGFFTNKEKRNRIDINAESGMVIETNKSGIDETFTKNNFEKLGKFKKVSKLHTIRLLPEIIQRGQLIADDVNNIHNNGNNKKFAYIEYPITVDEKNIVVKIAIKKSPQKNKFWVHSIYTTENASSSPASTPKGTEAGHITADNNNIIPQTPEKVNTPEEKSKKYSDRSRNNDRDILANVLADSKLNRTKKGLYPKMDCSPFIIYGKISENCLFILSIVT
jgi:hypothetical protein